MMTRPAILEWLTVAVVLITASLFTSRSLLAEEVISFSRHIRPILSQNCFQCHGPDEATREAGLRLDVRDDAVAERDGTPAILPGDPEGSELLARITSEDEFLQMPPPELGKSLTAEQIDLLRRWIEAGALYERHWAFEPVRRADPPEVKQADAVRNPIDRFILAELERNGLSPSPPADRHTLIRRVYLDFLGVPPTIEEVDRFVKDPHPDAYEQLLDRVLDNPRYGERWGRHWLDQARYADSHGYTNDNERSMWPYRDWVIDAVNRDLPFDRFTIEQLAGDLLAEEEGADWETRLAMQIATGFHRNTLINTEGGTKPDQFRDEQVKDRVDTTGSVWLALTLGCAQCHSHKFDPISQAEYYQFYAFFNSTADNNSTSPTIRAPSSEQQQRLDELDARRRDLQARIDQDQERPDRQRAWEENLVREAEQMARSEAEQEESWAVLELQGTSQLGAELTPLEDGSVLVGGANVAADEYQVTGRTPLTTVRSVRLEALTHESLPKNGPGRAGNGNFVLSNIWFRTGDGRDLRFSKAQADHSQPNYDVSKAIDGKSETGWAVNQSPEGGPNHNRVAWFVLPAPLEVEEGEALNFTMQFHNGNSPYNLGRFRISILSEEWIDMPSADELAKLAAIPADERARQQRQRLDEAFLQTDPKLGAVHAELQQAVRERDELLNEVPTTMVMKELDQPRQAHVQIRGDFLRPGDEVECNVPAVLPPLTETEEMRTRLDLARWLVRPDHPLTPRVQVNRVWMRLFGSGLVETENDFGLQGDLPTHPELLDWLASEFVEQGWSMKRLLKLIANSATYRQASAISSVGRVSNPSRNDVSNDTDGRVENPSCGDVDVSQAERVDPLNRLLWRQNRIRVEGEIVRDLGLSVSGLLSDKIGGPSVHPPQPEGVYAFTQRNKNWKTSQGEDRYRRGMYTFFYRSAPYPMLTTFDAPKFNQTCTRRVRSNTPLQSLTVANDATMFEMAQGLARRALTESLAESGADEDRLTRMFRHSFSRPPSEPERAFLLEHLDQQREHFEQNAEAARAVSPPELPEAIPVSTGAAWTATARVLLNLDEFITRE